MTELAIIDNIRYALQDLFGIPPERVDRKDEVGPDWGIVEGERDLFEAELYKIFPRCAESFRDCVTIEDFARMVGP
ncbi:hypothetical protein EVB39_066 [Rhizobium phage RHph_TM3_3_9]|nr:hypothetical protein EVB39_066 [Rhizobium phage RHph_TM3_3_9]QIG68587.1 hypothetical protein EVB66_066 [Rhizobium phage RHph_TM3_3_13]QIG74445.1 hypothetical protein EVC09_065 [Rhizobium phage RHph_TM3_3_10]QXV74559.1 hypothetical protein [Rhizobium phage RHEph19]